jgi:thiamine biosynthesis lipoprotein
MTGAPATARDTGVDVVTHEFAAMGTEWYVEASGVPGAAVERIAGLVEREEERFSRFRASSALSRLNDERLSEDAELVRCIEAAEVFRGATAGAFDAGVGDAVIAAGYSRDFDELTSPTLTDEGSSPSSPRLCMESDGRRIALIGEGRIDLGGIAKGWTVDLAARQLQSDRPRTWLIDAGGDIAVGGTEPTERLIAVGLTGLTVGLSEGAIATSSTMKRAWNTTSGRKHHIIDPRRGVPTQNGFVHATVRAPIASTADALATAMLTDPVATTRALSKYRAEAILVGHDGGVYMSPGMKEHLR